MKNKKHILLASAIFFATLASGRAQSTYTPYAFTNFVSLPSRPTTVAVDSAGNLYVTEFDNDIVQKVTPAGVVTTLAGQAGIAGTNNGTGGAARFNGPASLNLDSDGNVYVSDFNSHTIRKITPVGTNWVVTTLAGVAGTAGTNDGPVTVARFNNPIGVAVDSATNVYVGDFGNNTIRKITPAGEVTTLAGRAGQPGSADGTGNAARFNGLHGVSADSAGNLYVADTLNSTIRKITPAGMVTTLAGRAGQPGSADGAGNAARFYEPNGVTVTTNGALYVADKLNHTIRRITPGGAVTTLAGRALNAGSVNGIGSAARFNQPYRAVMDDAGNLYVADVENLRITKGRPLLQFDTNWALTVSNASFQMRLLGPSGSNAVVEASANLAAWTAVQTNTLPPAGLDVSVPLDTNPNQFFRARLAP